MARTRSVTGHTYEQLMSCEQAVWLRFHGGQPTRPKADPMARLKQEGIEHEEKVASSQYPHATVIPPFTMWSEGVATTLSAIREGHPAILQAVLESGCRRGIADVLEHVQEAPELPLGHLYRVGDIKRAERPAVSHVMQLVFYSRVLGSLQGRRVTEAFIIGGDGARHSFDLADFDEAFDRLDTRISSLRQERPAPGPHLCSACRACTWRGRCVPEVVEEGHLSLLPGITTVQAALLQRSGLPNVEAAARRSPDGAWVRPAAARRLQQAAVTYLNGKPLLRAHLMPSGLAEYTLADLEGSSAALTRASVERIHWVSAGVTVDAPFRALPPPSLPEGPLLVHGAERAEILTEWLPGREVHELNELVRTHYHLPLWTETLEELDLLRRGGRFLAEPEVEIHAPRARLALIEGVRRWLLEGE